ncbi:MAG: hypothetical protein QXI70_03295, partial [Methanothrix sp.]
TLQLRIQNIMGEAVARTAFNLTSPLYSTLPRLSHVNNSSYANNSTNTSDLQAEQKSDAKRRKTASPGAGAAAFILAVISSALIKMRGGLRRT